MPVRQGLARLEGVELISERCDRQKGTGQLRMRGGRLIDPKTLGQQIYDIRVGARLRGLEAHVLGSIEKREEQLFLRISGSDQQLLLAPLTRKVQIVGGDQKKLEPPTGDEKNAFQTLVKKWKGTSNPVRIIGPLLNNGDSSRLTLEVREFDLKPPTRSRRLQDKTPSHPLLSPIGERVSAGRGREIPVASALNGLDNHVLKPPAPLRLLNSRLALSPL